MVVGLGRAGPVHHAAPWRVEQNAHAGLVRRVLSDFSVAWRVMSDGRWLVALTFLPDGPRPDLILYSGELPRMFLVVLFT
jgi:hypothetical protein